KPGESVPVEVTIEFPPEMGTYRIFLSPVDQDAGWAYHKGEPFILVDADVTDGHVRVTRTEITTKRALRLQSLRRAIPKGFTYPFLTLFRHHRLIRSLARRDILARYRGSLGDVLWTFLNPLLLMSTYIFVFGVVLHARFGGDRSSTGFALYFLAGMLPWLAFSEPAGRAPYVIFEHRNFVKKLIFPLETLPVNQVVAGLVTEFFALSVFLMLLVVLRGSLPITVLWLPVLIVPQVCFTLGVCWFLAGLGVFFRDLGQIMGFGLTLWFFLTPICYPETSLPPSAAIILRANPLYALVRGYRAIFLEGQAPSFGSMTKFWLISIVVFLLGHAWFHKLRKTFADVI
ncbi:MAG: ABC transporter permease, partial [Acidobacteriota bacterium]|nr:ABC transporter permease [Acidobacteriota bacterium]